VLGCYCELAATGWAQVTEGVRPTGLLQLMLCRGFLRCITMEEILCRQVSNAAFCSVMCMPNACAAGQQAAVECRWQCRCMHRASAAAG
jgi:hypothetical protein